MAEPKRRVRKPRWLRGERRHARKVRTQSPKPRDPRCDLDGWTFAGCSRFDVKTYDVIEGDVLLGQRALCPAHALELNGDPALTLQEHLDPGEEA
jgi:hypothetical protein